MKLSRLIEGIEGAKVYGDASVEIASICFDSRKSAPGALFVAISGTEQDGHAYIPAAIGAGASAVVFEHGDAPEGVVSVRVSNARRALGDIAAAFYGHPSEKLNLVGITGTNGKTTTVTLLYRLFTNLGYSCGLISTIANYIDGEKFPTDHTTPNQIELNSLLARMADHGCEYCFMEVSSHSCQQERIHGLKFRGGIFSNLTHDHLDYHKTFEEYLRCKKLFFDGLPKDAFALVNIDDRNGMVMLQNTAAQKRTYSCRAMADFHCSTVESTFDGMLLKIDGNEVWTRFIGAHNAYNLLAVYSTAILLGADRMETLKVISTLSAVSGRLEYIKGVRGITAVVDYAHTPDALENVLKTLGGICDRQSLICVFGCGGNRDRTKRPEMGAIAARYADRVVVTSDNPRMEKPEDIIGEIKAGMDAASRARSIFITDRREAIRTAILTAPDNSVILVAGKGHEDYQIIGTEKFHFDDREVIREVFAQQ